MTRFADESTATRLLLIDDDPSIVRLLEDLLERSLGDCIEIEPFTDAVKAHSRILETPIDILLTDLEMPSISGLELLRSAKRRNEFVQVVLLTGRSTRTALLDAMELGATDYLLKPATPHELVELVSQAHKRRQRWLKTMPKVRQAMMAVAH